MRPSAIVALALLLALAASSALTYKVYTSWSSQSRGVVESYYFPSSAPYSAPYSQAPTEAASLPLSYVLSLINAGAPPQVLERAIASALSSPALRALGVSDMVSMINASYFDLRTAYDMTMAAESLEANGSLAEAALYANESLALLARVNATASYVAGSLPRLYNLLGPKGVALALYLLNRTTQVSGTLTGIDESVLMLFELSRAVSLVGLVTINLTASPNVTYGGQLRVSGTVTVNLTKPAEGVTVVLRAGPYYAYAVANSSGRFTAYLTAPFNSSGAICVEALLAPVYRGAVSSPAYSCSRLVYYRPNLTISVSPSSQLPGSYVNVSVTASGACGVGSPTAYVMGQAYGMRSNGRAAWAEVPVPDDAPTGPLQVYVYVSEPPPCVPAGLAAWVNVTRLPMSLEVSAPPVWPGFLPLPLGVSVRPSSGPGAESLSLKVNNEGSYLAAASGSSTLLLPYFSLLGGYAVISVNATPLNVTYTPAEASARVYEVPGALLAPLAAAAVYVVAVPRRRRGATATPEVRPPEAPRPTRPLDPLLARAWRVLEGLASSAGLPVTPSRTARELARAVSTARPELVGAVGELVSAVEALAYGGGGERHRARLAELLGRLEGETR